MEIFTVNCFCNAEANSGNPAAIIQNFQGDHEAKQNVAKKLNLPVTVFIGEFDHGAYPIEFYYPSRAMPLCLHGTLGAAFILLQGTQGSELNFITQQKKLLSIRKNKDLIQVRVTKDQIPEVNFNKAEVAKMLKLRNHSEIMDDLPFLISSVGSPKLLVPVKSSNELQALTPDFDLINEWSNKNNINGLYVYAPKQHNHFYARGFNPKGGHNEDAATGVAAAALALALQSEIIIEQGHMLNRLSQIVVTYLGSEEIWVGGRVKEVITAEK